MHNALNDRNLKFHWTPENLTFPSQSLGKGNVFTSVCHSFYMGVCLQGRGLHQVGGCIQGIRYYGIRSTSERYTSYWNTFFFLNVINLPNLPLTYSAIYKATGLTVPGRSMIYLVLFHHFTIPTVKPSMGEQPLGVIPAAGIFGNGR